MNNNFNFIVIILALFITLLAPPTTAYSGDTQPPHIELQDLSDNQTFYTNKIYISGQVTDAHDIETLKLNNTSLIRSPGRSIFFSHLVKLSEGENMITIEAADEDGNRAKKEITVTRAALYPLQLPRAVIDQRMRIAVYPFEESGTISETSGLFRDLLMFALEQENRFQITDRALMDRILEEQKLSLTHIIDQDVAVKIGRIMSAQAVICGSIIETGQGMEVVSRMIDTETSEIIATERMFSGDDGLTALRFLGDSAAVQLHNRFPMHRGAVLKRKGKFIFTGLGKDKIPLHGRFIIYRDNDLKTYNTILGYARIIQVLPKLSKAELISGDIDEIRELDRVVLQ